MESESHILQLQTIKAQRVLYERSSGVEEYMLIALNALLSSRRVAQYHPDLVSITYSVRLDPKRAHVCADARLCRPIEACADHGICL